MTWVWADWARHCLALQQHVYILLTRSLNLSQIVLLIIKKVVVIFATLFFSLVFEHNATFRDIFKTRWYVVPVKPLDFSNDQFFLLQRLKRDELKLVLLWTQCRSQATAYVPTVVACLDAAHDSANHHIDFDALLIEQHQCQSIVSPVVIDFLFLYVLLCIVRGPRLRIVKMRIFHDDLHLRRITFTTLIWSCINESWSLF